MNERLKELAAQCWEIRKWSPPWFDSEKFAELIVRGCAMKANATAIDLRNHPDLDGRKYVGDRILKCFGVEE
jgi:hypothetical protein